MHIRAHIPDAHMHVSEHTPMHKTIKFESAGFTGHSNKSYVSLSQKGDPNNLGHTSSPPIRVFRIIQVKDSPLMWPLSGSCSHQRPQHREDAGSTHDEQPAQSLGVIVLHHLDHPQQGFHPRSPQMPHVEALQVQQAGPGAVTETRSRALPDPVKSHGLQHPPRNLGQSKGFRKAGLGTGDTGYFHRNGNVKRKREKMGH